ncbi:MalY/PatB family protein [Clostridium cochlearium]|uniref:MalY/PatB family protein n=1 Tax=Clostridium cochlearium TaxID=1494 RepID=UPI0022DEC38D|nr:MalY/PatB family protein [Clostridium cochlearium]
MYNFNEIVERKNTSAVKWDKPQILYNRSDIIPMGIADMDFRTAPEIIEAIKNRTEHGVFGYSYLDEEYYNSLINWLDRIHNFKAEEEWVCTAPTIVAAISWMIQSYTEEGDKIIIQPPVYHQFKRCIESNNRIIVNNPLKYENNKYFMDFEDLESKIDSKVKMMILCNPHNPGGRVWKQEELKKLGDICLKHNILMLSDEIHCDLIFKGYKHIPIINVDKKFEDISLICISPTKTFNLAALHVSNVIIPNKDLRDKYLNTVYKNAVEGINVLGIEAMKAAYKHGEGWYRDMLKYVEDNYNFLCNYIEEKIPQLKVTKSEGTYLAWIDFRGLSMNCEQLREFIINEARVLFDEGYVFGKEGEGFQRINLACSRTILKEALDRICMAMENVNKL